MRTTQVFGRVSFRLQNASSTHASLPNGSSMRFVVLAAAALSLLGPLGAAAQLAPDDPPASSSRAVSIAPRIPLDADNELGEMELDGALGEPDWQGAQIFRGFTQRQPVEGEPAGHDTEVRVLFGEGAVWIGARMWDSAPEGIVARLTRRDTDATHDYFGVILDPNVDGLTGYGFVVN